MDRTYFSKIIENLERINETQAENIKKAASLMADAIERIAPHINENGVIVCETGSEEFLPENIEGFTSKRYKYGKIALTVYRKGE